MTVPPAAPAGAPRWPDVPACHGWLALDRRGRWWLRGEPMTHPGLRAAIAANYTCDDAGAWYFRNGPQRVYVDLECAPWVLRLGAGGRLVTHTGREDATPRAAWVDDTGTVFIETSIGAGVLAGADLDAFAAALMQSDGGPAVEAAITAWLADAQTGPDAPFVWMHAGHALPVRRLAADAVPARLGFVRRPRAGD